MNLHISTNNMIGMTDLAESIREIYPVAMISFTNSKNGVESCALELSDDEIEELESDRGEELEDSIAELYFYIKSMITDCEISAYESTE